MMKIIILIMIAASFAGFWLQREAHSAKAQSIIVSLYFIGVVAIIFGGFVP